MKSMQLKAREGSLELDDSKLTIGTRSGCVVAEPFEAMPDKTRESANEADHEFFQTS